MPRRSRWQTWVSRPSTAVSAQCVRRASTAPLPSAPGSYVLVLETSARRRLAVGALGVLVIEPGFYAYVGSALGPGGLAARLGHHLRRAAAPHWHIDHVRLHAAPREIWLSRGASRREHEWAAIVGSHPGATIPLPRFGASDCRCESHLFRFARQPRIRWFRGRVAAVGPAAVSGSRNQSSGPGRC